MSAEIGGDVGAAAGSAAAAGAAGAAAGAAGAVVAGAAVVGAVVAGAVVASWAIAGSNMATSPATKAITAKTTVLNDCCWNMNRTHFDEDCLQLDPNW